MQNDSINDVMKEINDQLDMDWYLTVEGYHAEMGLEPGEPPQLHYACMLPGCAHRGLSFVLDFDKRFFSCAQCGRQGGVVELIQALRGMSLQEAIDEARGFLDWLNNEVFPPTAEMKWSVATSAGNPADCREQFVATPSCSTPIDAEGVERA